MANNIFIIESVRMKGRQIEWEIIHGNDPFLLYSMKESTIRWGRSFPNKQILIY